VFETVNTRVISIHFRKRFKRKGKVRKNSEMEK